MVITATKTGTEKNATVFARYWVEALRDPAADTDKNETISALEAFRYAERKITGVLRLAEAARHRACGARRHRQRRGGARALARKMARACGRRHFRWCGWAAATSPRTIPQKQKLLEKKEAAGAADRRAEVQEGRHAGRGVQETAHRAAAGIGARRRRSWTSETLLNAEAPRRRETRARLSAPLRRCVDRLARCTLKPSSRPKRCGRRSNTKPPTARFARW